MLAQGTSCFAFDPSPFHSGLWLIHHDRSNSQYEKVRTRYERVEGGESRWGFETERDTHGRANFCLQVLELGWQPSCGDSGQWAEGGLCVCLCMAFAAVLPTLSNHSGRRLEWHFRKFPLMWDWGPSCQDRAAWRGLGGVKWAGEIEGSVGCCLSDLARSRSFMAYGGEHW